MAQVRDKDYLIQQQADEIERLRREVKKQQEKMIELAKKLPKRGDGCDICRNGTLEEGDTLYKSSDWDGGIGFDYIRDIRFCPICGRKLEVQE